MIRSRDVSLYAAGMVFQQLVTFLSGVLVARWLGPGDYGVLSLARNVFAVALILVPLGLDLALLRHIGQHSGSQQQLRAEVSALRVIVMGVSLAAVAAVLCTSSHIERYLYPHEDFAKVLVVAFLALPFAADLALLGAVFRGRQRPVPQVIVGLYVTPLLRLVITVLLLWAGLGIVSILYATLASSVFAVALLSYLLWRWNRAHGSSDQNPVRVERRDVRVLLGGSLWLALGLLVYGLLRSLDIFILGAFRPDTEVGEYAALSVIAQMIIFLPQALSQTMGAVVARQYADKNLGGMAVTLLTYLRHASLLTAPVFGGIAIFAPWLDLVFGDKFHFRADVALLLSSACYIGAVLAPMGYSLSMTGRHRVESVVLTIGMIVAAVACLILVPTFGQLGAAAGIVCGYLVINGSRVALVVRIHQVRLFQWRDLLPPVVALALALMVREMGGALLGRSLPGLIVLCAIYIGLCLATWWTLLLHEDEKEFVVRRFGRDIVWKRS